MEKFKSLIQKSRNYFIAVLLIAVAVVTYGAVTSTTSYFKVKDTGNATIVEWSFTLDSLTALASPTFNLGNAAYDFSSQQITFYKKTVSTYGTPIVDCYLQDVGFTTTDTMTVDTLFSQSVTEADSSGITKPLFSTSGNQMALGMMKLYVRALNVDVNSGKIRVVFPKRGR